MVQTPFVLCVVSEMPHTCAADAIESTSFSTNPHASAPVLKERVDALAKSDGCRLQAARWSDVPFQMQIAVVDSQQPLLLTYPNISGMVDAQ